MFGRTFEVSLIAVLALELATLSLAPFPAVGPALFWIAVGLFLVLAFKDERLALLILLAELIYGAKGHMFEANIAGIEVSVRTAFFIIVLVGWLLRGLYQRERFHELLREPALRWISGILLFLLVAALIGFFRGNAPRNIYLDGNGYLLFLLAFPASTVVRASGFQKQAFAVFLSMTTLLAVKSLLLLAAFSHQFEVNSLVYRWVRDPRMYEITALTHNFYRVFSQSQIFNLIAFFCLLLVTPVLAQSRIRKWVFVLLLLNATTVILSFSRSFWLAFLAAMLLVPFLLPKGVSRFRTWLRLLGIGTTTFVLALLLVSFAANYPYLWNRPGSIGTLALLEKRGVVDDASVSSRFTLIAPLANAALEHPVLGSGLGTTVTFRSKDPRVITQTGGVRTTYAFEWGYLDFLLKFGLLGTAYWLFFLWRMGRNFFAHVHVLHDHTQQRILLGLGTGFLLLVLTHGMTPYLNHPLGISFLVFLSFLAWPARA